MKYRVLLPTAGLGTRLGNLSKNVNKALVAVDNKPVISHVIEKFPKDVEIVVALGYKGNLVRDYLQMAHHDRTIIFVDVERYVGPGSGLGHTILACKDHLQCPFVFCTNDAVILENIPAPSENWMGYTDIENSEDYRSVNIGKDGIVKNLYEKDEGLNAKPYIGVAGINNYSMFWQNMLDGVLYGSIQIGESYGLRKMIDQGAKVRAKKFSWYDTGNLKNLKKTREVFKRKNSPEILEKPNEAIWFANNRAIKYAEDKTFISDRIQRSKVLKGYVPEVIDFNDNMYCYKLINGKTMSRCITKPLFLRFLEWIGSFWSATELSESEQADFRNRCISFYKEKTEKRIFQYFSRFRVSDGEELINDVQVSKLSDLLDKVDWGLLSNGAPTRYHGDLHFENILVAENGEFCLLDWRQNFAGLKDYGDVYYDLAKLYHGIIVSHELVNKNYFNIKREGEVVTFDILRNHKLTEAEKIFESFIAEQGYDLYKVRLLTALIFLNIAPLHHHPYSEFLFYLGKYQLNELVNTGE